MEGVGDNVSIARTPTYAVATTAFLFILLSFVGERSLHGLKKNDEQGKVSAEGARYDVGKIELAVPTVSYIDEVLPLFLDGLIKPTDRLSGSAISNSRLHDRLFLFAQDTLAFSLFCQGYRSYGGTLLYMSKTEPKSTIEQLLTLLTWMPYYLKRKNQKPLRKVLNKMTEELMLLGFISLLLTVLQNSVVKICMPASFATHLLPCHRQHLIPLSSTPASSRVSTTGRKLLYSYVDQGTLDLGPRRHLLTQNVTRTGHCSSQGKVPFISLEVLHSLHIFIFVLAVTHVFYSFVTVCLGFARLQRWRQWEEEIKVEGFDGTADLERRYREILQTGKHYFGRHSNAFFDGRHHSFYDNPISIWILCFLQQFFHSVSKEDYLVLRVRFLNVEFKIVIGISWWLWLFVALFLLLNIHGWNTHFWVAFVPAVLVLVIGTTQQHIISTLSLQAKRHAADVAAAENSLSPITETDTAPHLSGSDKLFWFDNSKLVLRLLHFVMFQNSFELAIFFWLVTDVGWHSCVLGNHKLFIVRVIVGLATQLLASSSTLPIYALVTQMGSQMKETVFTKHVYRNLKKWKSSAKKISVRRAQSESSLTQLNDQQTRPEDSAESSTAASQPVPPSAELTILPKEGTFEEGPGMPSPSPKLVKRLEMMYGKAGARSTASAESPTAELRIPREEGTSEVGPGVSSPKLVKRFQKMFSVGARSIGSAESPTAARRPVRSMSEVTIPPEEGTSEEGPGVSSPKLVKRFQKMFSVGPRSIDSAESPTAARRPVRSISEVTIPPEEGTSEDEGTSEEGPRVPNPELVKRFQKIYGKVRAMQKFKPGP